MTQPSITSSERAKLTARAAIASIAMAITLIVLKSYAAFETSSMAMLGSLADSGLDLVASLVVLLGVRIAAQPADYDHRFGHGKAEALAALVQVILISLSAIFIGFRAIQRLLSGAETAAAELGIGVSVVAMVLTVALISYQRHVVKRTGSLAIGTDRLHYSSDLLLNGSVIVALALDQFAHLSGADAMFGILIAAWLMWGAASSHSPQQAGSLGDVLRSLPPALASAVAAGLAAFGIFSLIEARFRVIRDPKVKHRVRQAVAAT